MCLPRIIGVPCLTTGLTRAFHAMAEGRLADAVAFHPASPALYALTVLAFAVSTARLSRPRGAEADVNGWFRPAARMAGGVLLIVWAARLLGLAPIP